jgi:hypothetical protein
LVAQGAVPDAASSRVRFAIDGAAHAGVVALVSRAAGIARDATRLAGRTLGTGVVADGGAVAGGASDRRTARLAQIATVVARVRGIAAPADHVGLGTVPATAGAVHDRRWATPLAELPAGADAPGTDPESGAAAREPAGVAVRHADADETATACRTRVSGAAPLTRAAAGEADVVQSVGRAERVGGARR